MLFCNEYFSAINKNLNVRCEIGRLRYIYTDRQIYKSTLRSKIRNIFIGQEFMIATDMTTGGSLEERLRWAFKMFDKDGSGKVLIITK